MASLRDVARVAGVGLATASRVTSGLDAVRPETRARRAGDARSALCPAGPKRRARSACSSPSSRTRPCTRSGDGGARDGGGLATILCNTTSAAFREVDYVHMLLDREGRRDDLHLPVR